MANDARGLKRLKRKLQQDTVTAISIVAEVHGFARFTSARHLMSCRYWKLVLSGKSHNKAVIAIARELAGFIWATPYQRESTVINEPRPAPTADRRSASRVGGEPRRSKAGA